jgi:hypothetical protein
VQEAFAMQQKPLKPDDFPISTDKNKLRTDERKDVADAAFPSVADDIGSTGTRSVKDRTAEPFKGHPMKTNLLIALVAGAIALAGGIAAYKRDATGSGPTTKAVSAKTVSD